MSGGDGILAAIIATQAERDRQIARELRSARAKAGWVTRRLNAHSQTAAIEGEGK